MVGLVDVVRPGLPGDHAPAQAGHGDDGDDVDQVDGGHTGEDDQPEPQGDVDLLVDDVQTKDAEGVLLVHRSWEKRLVENRNFQTKGEYLMVHSDGRCTS